MNVIIAAAVAAAVQPSPEAIVVTASREPVAAEEAGVSVSVVEENTLDALALPATSDVLRTLPGVSVATSGPRGTQTQVRLRGAETHHTLLFVDGIRFNDPAADNFARFELLTNDALSRIEVVRGPQSALWGSEALGGVVAIETADPLRSSALGAFGEYGSLDSARASLQFAQGSGKVGIGGSAGWLRSAGIDSFGGGAGERDGFENRSGGAKLAYAPSPELQLGLVGHWIESESEYDGLHPVTFKRADTLDTTENQMFATRGWARFARGGWSALLEGSYLDSANRNLLDDARLNSTFGKRFTLGGQVSKRLGGHRLTGAVDHQAEDFRARDRVYFGGTDQDRSRGVTAFVGQWRAEWSKRLVTDLAVRHDDFTAFADATTLRAIVSFKPGRGWTVHAGYGEGIAQPTFNDLYGFFPGSFVGNPDLQPETSRGWEAGLRWQNGATSLGVTGFASRLRDEIVEQFDPATFLSSTRNVAGASPRRGVELEARHRLGALDLAANYTFLVASERQARNAPAIREIRRPRHSANLVATTSLGAFTGAAALSYVGKRRDTDFDIFSTVTLSDYLLASVKLGWRLGHGLEAYARIENALAADYQDVVGYNTPGRTVHAGLRIRLGD
jgi:vitamin B12 transporter